MPGYRSIPRPQTVKFLAVDVTEMSADFPRAGNDNNCPHCGGVLEPGDKASDCSGSKAWLAQARPLRTFPKSSEASR